MDAVGEVVEKNSELYLGWLTEACSIPTVAENPDSLVQMAKWLEEKFTALGATVERIEHKDAPVALLATMGSGDRSLLIYDHYDVQPVDPIELWDSKPFEPEIRDGKFFARGAADNKGDLIARLAGLHAYLEVHGSFPVSIKFMVEGEEETGSGSFQEIAVEHADAIRADGCIWEGNGIDHEGRPEFVFGAKGLAYFELNYQGLTEDQHSSTAVYVPSPVWRMVEALTTLRSPDGTVLIDGFYDDIVEPTEQDIEMLKNLPFAEEEEKKRLGIDAFVNDSTDLELKRRIFFEPSCNIAGFVTGFTVPGASKTVLPKEVMVKLDMRLVPNQSPEDIHKKLRAHLDKRGFDDIAIRPFSAEHPVRSPSDSLVARASIAAAEGIFEGTPALQPMMIGTGPMYPIAAEVGIPTVSPAGVCRPDSNIHAPNENCRVDDFYRIVRYTAAYVKTFSEIEA